MEKPRLFLRHADFEAEQSNAYHIDGAAIHRREAGETLSLTRLDNGFRYKTTRGSIQLSKDLAIEGTPNPVVSLRPAVEMAVVFEGLRTSAGYLPCFTREAIA